MTHAELHKAGMYLIAATMTVAEVNRELETATGQRAEALRAALCTMHFPTRPRDVLLRMHAAPTLVDAEQIAAEYDKAATARAERAEAKRLAEAKRRLEAAQAAAKKREAAAEEERRANDEREQAYRTAVIRLASKPSAVGRTSAKASAAGKRKAKVQNVGDRKRIRAEVNRLAASPGMTKTAAYDQVAEQAQAGRAGKAKLTTRYDVPALTRFDVRRICEQTE